MAPISRHAEVKAIEENIVVRHAEPLNVSLVQLCAVRNTQQLGTSLHRSVEVETFVSPGTLFI